MGQRSIFEAKPTRMKIGILGTGVVGEAIGTALIGKGFHVMMGSRTAGNEKARAWKKKGGAKAAEGKFEDTALYGDLIFICLNGAHALDALKSIPVQHLSNKIVIDLTNPLDFSQGMPPRLLEDFRNVSLGEQIQNALPGAYVVKTLNTVNYQLMIDARKVSNGHHSLFFSGNDINAKNKVKHFLVDNFHWHPEELVDLGGIETARATEAMVPFWVQVWQTVGTALFSFRLVK